MHKLILFFIPVFILLQPIKMLHAEDYGDNFLHSVRGQWSGKGEVVAGRYKGIKFNCKFNAPAAKDGIDMTLTGTCRTGIFSQPISAKIQQKEGTLRGSFNEGAQAQGLDITKGVIHKNHMILELSREKLNGNMEAKLEGDNLLRITLAVKIDEDVIPVIGMNLNRTQPAVTTAAVKDNTHFAWLQD